MRLGNQKAVKEEFLTGIVSDIKNVKKPSGSAPGKAVYEHYKTAYVRPAQFENIFGNK
mgnify:CR=1 FL=1